MEQAVVKDALKLIGICLLWYTTSSGGNIVGKLVLNEFPYPMTVTMVQLLSGALYLKPIINMMSVPDTGEVPRYYYWTMILPLALGKFLASVSSHISIWKVSVSYAHTVKATLPLFTVLLSRIILGEKQTYPVYCSLIPIIGGVVIATLTEISFDYIGLISALCATIGFSLQTIFSKKCLKETGLHHLRLYVTICRLAAGCFLPMWALFDLRRIYAHHDSMLEGRMLNCMVLLLVDGFFSMLQNVFAFTVIAMVAPLSYAVANATKRIVIIGASLFFLRNPVTPMNLLGMAISVFGVLSYNKVKYDQNVAMRHAATLPLVKSTSNLEAMDKNHVSIMLHHSQSASDLKLHSNGLTTDQLHNHILFNNNHFQSNNVTLIPVQSSESTGDREWQTTRDRGNVHSRMVYHV
ncbi:solute carrier family 35 member E1 homolog [Mizuhopecten yessoensis]|uniref:solute carrier family 35 member E1 homolog n=1 Tax=Mizuhopecten yessoensis TaxID=6573 RepID=UPI000B4595C8|nr:solute carrier family 35 member E1 homolog [Mizuhopecten yessoensis]